MSRQEQGRAGGRKKTFTAAQMITGLAPLCLDLLLAFWPENMLPPEEFQLIELKILSFVEHLFFPGPKVHSLYLPLGFLLCGPLTLPQTPINMYVL